MNITKKLSLLKENRNLIQNLFKSIVDIDYDIKNGNAQPENYFFTIKKVILQEICKKIKNRTSNKDKQGNETTERHKIPADCEYRALGAFRIVGIKRNQPQSTTGTFLHRQPLL